MVHTAVQFGIGPIGSRIVETAVDRGYEFVGAVDVDPAKVGADLGEVVGLEEELGVKVSDEPAAALSASPDVVFHATSSSIEAVEGQLVEAMAAGADVISTTEELSYPWRAHPETAARVDAAAKEHEVSCLGTGINPGFAMDTLPAVLTAPCRSVKSVAVSRVQDAGTRRGPLQEKVGAGLSVEVWQKEIGTDAGHVGLPESVAMLAAGLGWELDDVSETIEPVVADSRTDTGHVRVEPGDAAGIHQTAIGVVDGTEVIELDLKLSVGAAESEDRISIRGNPNIEMVVDGGFHGDITTPGVVLNCVPRIQAAAPGLLTMLDLSTPRYHE